uniref:5'-3' DNA helicase ZGRF1-like N-terminal domain-containing protein n=1 Tax=Pelusios castaneus TaxID=367368 RepID=A0A8C8R5V6_9SAUR
MACQEFIVLYTHQKTKKSKVWQDGVLKASIGGNKATLFDDRGQCLESVFVKSQVKPGDDLESDRYLITVEAARVTENCSGEQPKKTETPTLNRNSLKPTGLFLPHLPVGLKRKHTGFQGPRQVEKKMVPMEDNATIISPSSKWSHSSFPSQLYITSPLFSTTCKKDAETSLPLQSNHNACTNSDRKAMSISSLVSTSYVGIPKEIIHNRSQSISISTAMESSCQTVSGAAVSQNIRSKAQIIALLKSNPTQLCREQKPSEITEHLSGCQPSESQGIVFNQKSDLVSGDADRSGKSTKKVHHQHTTEKTVSNNDSWDVYMLPNSAEQSCEEVTERKQGKVNNLGLNLQDPYNPKISQFVTASRQPVEKELKYNGMKLTEHKREYIWNCKTASQESASYESSNFETNLPKSSEHAVTDILKDSEVSSAESQSEPLPRINSGSIVHESRISGDVTWAGPGATNEELTACGSDPAEQFMEINFNLLDAFDFDPEDKEIHESNTISRGSGWLTKGAMAQKAEMRVHRNCEVMHSNEKRVVKYSTLLGERDENQIRESLPLQLCNETCEGSDKIVKAAPTPSLIELVHSETENVVNGVNASPLNIETTDSKKDLLMMNTKCSELVHNSSLLSLPLKPSNSNGLCQYIIGKYPTAFDTTDEEHTQVSRTATYPLEKGYSSSKKVEIGEIEFKNVSTSMHSIHEVREVGRLGTDCPKHLVQNDNSSVLPELVNSITLLRSLTEHRTALESLQMIEDHNGLLYQRETTKEQNEPSEGLQVIYSTVDILYFPLYEDLDIAKNLIIVSTEETRFEWVWRLNCPLSLEVIILGC